MTMQSDHYMRTLMRITLLASAFLSFSASAWTPYNYQVVELSGVPYFDKPIHVAIRTREEWLSFTKLPGIGQNNHRLFRDSTSRQFHDRRSQRSISSGTLS